MSGFTPQEMDLSPQLLEALKRFMPDDATVMEFYDLVERVQLILGCDLERAIKEAVKQWPEMGRPKERRPEVPTRPPVAKVEEEDEDEFDEEPFVEKKVARKPLLHCSTKRCPGRVLANSRRYRQMKLAQQQRRLKKFTIFLTNLTKRNLRARRRETKAKSRISRYNKKHESDA
ncbi:hypothetical protein KR200_005904 [Drosophila serrata]|nr:hypothetical protein KR200_005904 [Drosophila serrata]